MKKNIPFLLLTSILIFSLFMCEREKEILSVDDSGININTNAFLLTFKDNNDIVETDAFSIPFSNENARSNDDINLSSLRLDKNNLNHLLTTPSSSDVISIISFSQSNVIKGIATYYILNSKLYVKLDNRELNNIFQVDGDWRIEECY